MSTHNSCPLIPIDAPRVGYDNPLLDYPLYLNIMARWFSALSSNNFKQFSVYSDDKSHSSIIPNFAWINNRPWPDLKTLTNFVSSQEFHKSGSIFEAIIKSSGDKHVHVHKICNTSNHEERLDQYLASIALAARAARTDQLQMYTDRLLRGNEKLRSSDGEFIPFFSLRCVLSPISDHSFVDADNDHPNDDVDVANDVPEPLEVRTGSVSRPTSNDV